MFEKIPKGLKVDELSFILSQDEDSFGRPDEEFQEMKVNFNDAGGGFYYVIETKRWAFNPKERELFNYLDNICQELDESNES